MLVSVKDRRIPGKALKNSLVNLVLMPSGGNHCQIQAPDGVNNLKLVPTKSVMVGSSGVVSGEPGASPGDLRGVDSGGNGKLSLVIPETILVVSDPLRCIRIDRTLRRRPVRRSRYCGTA